MKTKPSNLPSTWNHDLSIPNLYQQVLAPLTTVHRHSPSTSVVSATHIPTYGDIRTNLVRINAPWKIMTLHWNILIFLFILLKLKSISAVKCKTSFFLLTTQCKLLITILFYLPKGLSNVLLGVRTTGKEDRCFPPRRKPVDAVSTSDMIPGSSSNRKLFVGGGYRGRGGCWKKV